MAGSDDNEFDAALPGPAAVGRPDAITSTQAVEATAPDAVEGTRAIAEALASGALDPVAAQHLLIEQVLAEQLPADLDPVARERLRGELAALLEADPTLAALLSA